MAAGQKTGGRSKGTPNKCSAEVKATAQKHGVEAIELLAHLMKNASSEQAQIAAAREILDRAYGKAPIAVVGDADSPPIKSKLEVTWLSDVDRPPRETREEWLARHERKPGAPLNG